jgi:hypothetical protein
LLVISLATVSENLIGVLKLLKHTLSQMWIGHIAIFPFLVLNRIFENSKYWESKNFGFYEDVDFQLLCFFLWLCYFLCGPMAMREIEICIEYWLLFIISDYYCIIMYCSRILRFYLHQCCYCNSNLQYILWITNDFIWLSTEISVRSVV